MDLDTRHLRALVAVVDEGTFTDAAIALRTSQASVSRSVQRLETLLGHRLLARSSRSVTPTPAGERMLVHARRVLAAVDQLEPAATGAAEQLRVGYAWAAFGRHTAPVLRRWEEEQATELVLVQTNTRSAGLLEGRCDASIVRRPVTDPRLAGAHIGDEHRVAALAEDHPLAGRPTVSLADLAAETVAVDQDTGTTSQELWRSRGESSPRLRPTRGGAAGTTRRAAGRAVGVSSEATAAQHPRTGITFRPVDDAPPIAVWLAWWRDDPPRGLDSFVGLCREAYAAADRGAGPATDRSV